MREARPARRTASSATRSAARGAAAGLSRHRRARAGALRRHRRQPATKTRSREAIRDAVAERLRPAARPAEPMARAPKLEEERPPHDALEGVPLPRETTILVGHRGGGADAARRLSLRADAPWLDLRRRARHRQGDARLPARALRLRASRSGRRRRSRRRTTSRCRPTHPGGAPRRGRARTAISCICSATGTRRTSAIRTELSVDSVRRIIPFLGTHGGRGRLARRDRRPGRRHEPERRERHPEEPRGAAAADAVPAHRANAAARCCRRSSRAPARSTSRRFRRRRPRRWCRRSRRTSPTATSDGLAAALAGGSPRRLIELARRDGVELYRLMRRGDRSGRPPGAAQARRRSPPTRRRREQFLELFEGYLEPPRARRCRSRRPAQAAGRAACHLGGAMGKGGAFRAGGRGIQSRPQAVRARSPRELRRPRFARPGIPNSDRRLARVDDGRQADASTSRRRSSIRTASRISATPTRRSRPTRSRASSGSTARTSSS